MIRILTYASGCSDCRFFGSNLFQLFSQYCETGEHVFAVVHDCHVAPQPDKQGDRELLHMHSHTSSITLSCQGAVNKKHHAGITEQFGDLMCSGVSFFPHSLRHS